MAKTKPRQGHPGRAAPKDDATIRVLALVKGSMEAVRVAERQIQQTIRAGGDPTHDIEVHHYLRVGALGVLVAYSQMTGLPDPRGASAE